MLHPPEVEQAELLRRVASRDIDALGKFYDQTSRSLFSIAHRMLLCREEAEEVIQDVFVQIWKSAHEYDHAKGHPFGWAVSITRNRCIDRLRVRQRRARAIVSRDGGAGDMGANDQEPDLLPENETAIVRSAVKGLPQEQRKAIEMAFFGGMTHAEIAHSLNEPMGTIKARIRRGMLRLRDVLKEVLQEGL